MGSPLCQRLLDANPNSNESQNVVYSGDTFSFDNEIALRITFMMPPSGQPIMIQKMQYANPKVNGSDEAVQFGEDGIRLER